MEVCGSWMCMCICVCKKERRVSVLKCVGIRCVSMHMWECVNVCMQLCVVWEWCVSMVCLVYVWYVCSGAVCGGVACVQCVCGMCMVVWYVYVMGVSMWCMLREYKI